MDYCGDCKYLNRDKEYNRGWFSSDIVYKCEKTNEYKKINDSTCGEFTPFKKQGNYTPSGCYITTIVCDILGYEDNCEVLILLRSFRDNYLKKDLRYLGLLVEYDQIGPMIAKSIKKEKNNYLLANCILKFHLIPCAQEIKAGNYEEAINIYYRMVDSLKDEFNLSGYQIDMNNINNEDNLGKGRILAKNE